MSVLITGYLAVAAFVAVWSLYGGVLSRRPVKLFGPAEAIVLTATAAGVGLLWLLFIPGLAAVAARHLRRAYPAALGGWVAVGRTARVRG